MKKQPIKIYPTLGCCGLDCGLCPRYYTTGSSKCPGCCGQDFFNKHPSCSYITCCVKKKNLEVCAQCDNFPCSKFESLLTDGTEYDSFLTYKKVNSNLSYVKKYGIDKFINQQKDRIKLLGIMLKHYNEGRSKSFYCIATTLLPIKDLETSLNETEQKLKASKIKTHDIKAKSKIIKNLLIDFADKKGIELKLRKKAKK